MGQASEFKGKPNEIVLLHTMGLIPASRLMLLGLGKKDDFKLDTLRKAMGTAAKKGRAWEGASALLSNMTRDGFGFDVNAITCNAAINACEKGSGWERASTL